MRIIKSCLTTIATIVVVLGFSQSDKIVPATPNAWKLTEFHAKQPGLYTGTVNVSIPLHSINFDGWELPISLSYNATGIRTNEEASEVGLGWTLSATGMISRTIRGGDDLFQGTGGSFKGFVYNDYAVPSANDYDEGNDLGYRIKVDAAPPSNSYYTHLAHHGPDTQPDIFNYNFFGYSGSFTLSQKVSTNGVVKIIKIKQDATSILFNDSTQNFTVITPDGYRGEFTVKEKSTSFSASIATNSKINCCGQNNIDMTAMINSSGRFRTTTSWYLSKITSPKGQIIKFNYDLRIVGSDNDNNTYSPSYPNGSMYSPYLSNSRTFDEMDNINPHSSNDNHTCLQTVQEHIYLLSIVSKEVQIDFLMETREDLRRNYLYEPDSNSWKVFHKSLNLKRYAGITIQGRAYLGSTLNKAITFKQGYFNQQYQDAIPNNQKEAELRWLRSRLDGVTIDDQVYQFFYENGLNGLPNKLTYGIDHFGFYNGQDQQTTLYPPRPVIGTSSCQLSDTLNPKSYEQLWDRRVDFSYGKAGVLNKIIYPTRGWTVFEYEPHVYMPEQTSLFRETSGYKNAGGARIKSIKEFDYTNDQVPIRTTTYKYTDTPTSSASTTTGKLLTPLLNRYIKKQRETSIPNSDWSSCVFFFKTNTAMPGSNSAEGKVIGYSKVHEIVTGAADSYKNTYYFENRPNETLKWNLAISGFPDLNGQLMDSRKYNSLEKIVQRTVNLDYEHTIDTINAIAYIQGYASNALGVCCVTSPDHIFYTFSPIKRVFNTPRIVVTYQGNSQTGFTDADVPGTIQHYIPSSKAIHSTKTYTYNANYLVLTEQDSTSSGDVLKTKYLRAADYSTPSQTLLLMQRDTVNMVSPVVEEIRYKNGNVLSASATLYGFIPNLVPIHTYNYNRSLGNFANSNSGMAFPSPYELHTSFTAYDPSGYLLEYRSRDGVTHSFIREDSTQLPLVHGVGITYAQLKQAYDASLGSNYETLIRTHSNTTGKQISTYVHNPLVGVTKIAGPTGAKSTFEYDAYGRLSTVRDTKGYLVTQNRYHMKTRDATRILGLSGDVDFGTLTPDMYASQTVYYARCSDPMRTKVLTLTNSGQDDLTVTSLSIPVWLISSWNGGVIAPGTSVSVNLSFNNGFTLNNYSGSITVNSNMTSGTSSVTVSANYANRSNNISYPGIVDFGTVSPVGFQNITINNTGNAPLRLAYIIYDWDGISAANATNTVSPYFYVPMSSQCMGGTGFGQSITLAASFTPQFSGNVETKVSLFFDDGSHIKDAITLKGNKN